MKYAKFFLPCLLILACAAPAKADCGGLGLAYLYGYNGFPNTGLRPFVASPPYFALHPPVYYGQRHTRPYGASPFAAWPQLQPSSSYAPARHVERAQVIHNPYTSSVEVTPGNSPVVRHQPVEPMVIDNPYFQPQMQYTSQTRGD